MDPSGAVSTTVPPAPKQPGSDVKPRLTKDQHDILEQHFLAQHKPSTNVKKEFATRLGVPLDKINNWFQNRRAKVKQDRKKLMNQYNMTMNLPFAHQRAPVMPNHYPHPQDQQNPHMLMQPDFYSTADISPATIPVQIGEGPSALDLNPHMSQQHQQPQQPPQQHQHQHQHQPQQQPQQQQQYDMFRCMPEVDRAPAYRPNDLMNSIMAATNGAYMHESGLPADVQQSDFTFDTSGLSSAYSSDLAFTVSAPMSGDLAPSHPEFDNFADFQVDYSALTATDTSNSSAPEAQQSTGSISSGASPYNGTQSSATTQSPNGPTPPSIASLNSVYTGWTEDPNQLAQPKHAEEPEDQFAPYNLGQASASEQTLPFWPQDGSNQMFAQHGLYQQLNSSSHAIMTTPEHARRLSAAPSDLDIPMHFREDAFGRRNSSTSNLATNMDAIHIRNTTPDEFSLPDQSSSIAARRQKRPINLSSTAMRSASYSAPMPSPGGNNDKVIRRIRSTGIGNAGGRIQKSQPGSAQRSPMAMSFSEAAASPKFARTFSTSSNTTIGQGGSLAPPTPLTPQDFGNYWGGAAVIRPHSAMPDHNSPESMHTNWSSDQAGNVIAKTTSPPSSSMDLQSRFVNDALYRDTPPQSAPATQQHFHRTPYAQPPQTRAGFRSTTDLTIQQPKPSHFRRPSLPDSTQNQPDDGSLQYMPGGNMNYEDFSLSGIHHNVPFAPQVSAMPDFLVHQYNPPQGTNPAQGNFMRRPNEPQPKSYIFANQGPGDFGAQ
ncbi:hypothetical protein COCSADRAFT_233623 [Bipolaris sorokiniana ND90Pr]|uniref:Homeobox domain-containing protein n=1 Tax=Cochliobolus sativus (strain ND90Pr / ATCC 201652) TaxID=665912 RepID=M2SXW3_COCSN|nr:uncharacterized protein COCSADRAFT_233623 [Bipolaris sorokiniana ND90Pr]EMD61637.1 hypothetical protein COCSADRAFT_233623 [Bipolaris sorokiniana ND90Pr]